MRGESSGAIKGSPDPGTRPQLGALAPETRPERLRPPHCAFLPRVPNETTFSPDSVCRAVGGRRSPGRRKCLWLPATEG